MDPNWVGSIHSSHTLFKWFTKKNIFYYLLSFFWLFNGFNSFCVNAFCVNSFCVNAFGIGSAWDAVVVVTARFVAFAAKRTACARPDAARCTASPD